MFLTVTSGKNLKFPKGVLRFVDGAVYKISLRPGVLWFLVFTIPVFNTSLAAFFGVSFNLGPNYC